MIKDTNTLASSRESAETRSAEDDSRDANGSLNSEVTAKPTRRQFTAAYRLRIIEEADRCKVPGEVGQLLRREGLYASHLANWRKARHAGSLAGLSSKKRGAKPKAKNPLASTVRELEAKVTRLERELEQARTIMDVQEKVAGLLGFRLEDGKDL